jgi:ParB family chromosome partitioning protein
MPDGTLQRIPVSKIVPSPFQPRETFGKEELEALAESMRSVNVLQPIIVRPHKGGYQIACGERRWRAAQMAGWEDVPAVVKEMDDRTLQLYSIVENLHRLDLEPYEKEKAIHDLWVKYYKPQSKAQAELARDIGLSKSTVSHLIISYEDRNKMLEATTRKAVTTTDLHVTRGLESPVREELLQKKVSGEIAQKELEGIASVAKDAPAEKQRVIVEELVKETKKAHELLELAKEEAEEFGKGELQRVEIRLGPDENRLRRLAGIQKDIRSHLTVANIEMIKNETFRWKVIEILETIRDHCNAVLRQLEEREWYKK